MFNHIDKASLIVLIGILESVHIIAITILIMLLHSGNSMTKNEIMSYVICSTIAHHILLNFRTVARFITAPIRWCLH
jgi:hypothetical protein